ncbi:extracellular solute-binding protein [Paenibacillus sp. NPDC058174]|uniref:extracellular solute-binding protein n=1 Tax=Paenibacillus sp. NPDC058174 TaxID=3346366 RepID=UPI0036DBA785
MRKIMKKLTVGLVGAALIFGTVACSSEKAPAEGNANSGYTGDLDYVKLKMYAISDAPNNTDLSKQYWEKLNAVLKKELNTTIEFTYAAGNDYKNNYALAVASGEPYDLMQAAPGWLDYQSYAAKNAFLPLDELLPKYAPYLWSKVPKTTWDAASVNGKIYGVPGLDTGVTAPAFVYREDLRKKHNLPEIKSMADIETYLQGIKDNEPDIIPSDDYQSQVYGTSWIYTTPYIGIDEIHDRLYNFVYDPRNGEVRSVIETPEFKEYMYKMKDWADRGFWSSSVLTSTNWGVSQVLNGVAAASFNEQLPGYNNHATQVKNEHSAEGWELNYFMYFEANPDSVLQGSTTSNMAAISTNAKNPERALMVLDYIQQHEELWDLITYGTEGVNYSLTSDGMIDTSKIADGASFNYFPSGMFGNANFKKRKSDAWEHYDTMMEKINKKVVPDIFEGFVLDKSSIETEYTALNDVNSQFGIPLEAGLLSDVDKAYDKYLEKAKAAGLDKVRTEVEKQVKAWLASKK